MSRDEQHIALVSGGMDSTVAADIAIRYTPADLLVYLDTGTGLEKNRRYVERLASWMDTQLWTLRTHESYQEAVLKHGFPGKSRHGIMYRKLKERQLQQLSYRLEGELHLWTGVRRLESEPRMRYVEPEAEHSGGKWVWHAPIANWTKERCRDHIRRNEIPCSPLWDSLGRSGDCYCGCFGSPEEKLDTIAAGERGRVAWLEALEELSDQGNERDSWAWGAMSDAEKRAERVGEDQLTLCSSCGIPEPTD